MRKLGRPCGGGWPTVGSEKTGAECWDGAASSTFDSSTGNGRRVCRRGGLRLQVLLSLCSHIECVRNKDYRQVTMSVSSHHARRRPAVVVKITIRGTANMNRYFQKFEGIETHCRTIFGRARAPEGLTHFRGGSHNVDAHSTGAASASLSVGQVMPRCAIYGFPPRAARHLGAPLCSGSVPCSESVLCSVPCSESVVTQM
jgi:hypothetical protein